MFGGSSRKSDAGEHDHAFGTIAIVLELRIDVETLADLPLSGFEVSSSEVELGQHEERCSALCRLAQVGGDRERLTEDLSCSDAVTTAEERDTEVIRRVGHEQWVTQTASERQCLFLELDRPHHITSCRDDVREDPQCS